MANKLYRPGASHASSLIGSGDYDTSASWSFSAEDGNSLLGPNGDNWTNYARFHLGEDASAAERTKARYKYPYGKNGKVYRSGLVAIRQRAGQQNDTGIFDEAGSLIDKIDNKTSQEATQGIFMRGQTGDTAELDLFGAIGGNFFDGTGVTQEQFAAELRKISAKRVNLRVSSPGGDVFHGRAIANMIKQSGKDFTANIIGEASSAASIIVMAANNIHMAEGSLMLVHRCYTITIGNAVALRSLANDLETIDNEAIATYARKTGMKPVDIAALMDENRYMNAQEAFDKGFVDSIDAGATIMQFSSFNRSKLNLPPLPEQYRARRSAAVERLRIAAQAIRPIGR